jgi:hypothetical protein
LGEWQKLDVRIDYTHIRMRGSRQGLAFLWGGLAGLRSRLARFDGGGEEWNEWGSTSWALIEGPSSDEQHFACTVTIAAQCPPPTLAPAQCLRRRKRPGDS